MARTLDPINAIADDAYPVADAQLAFAHLADGETRAIFQPDDHAIVIAIGGFLDLIAGKGAAKRSRNRRRGVATAASDLVTENAAGDTADDRTQTRWTRFAVTLPFERFNDAVLDTLTRNRRRRAGTVIAVVVRLLSAPCDQRDARGCCKGR